MADWSINSLEHNTADGGVIIAHWECTDSETVGDQTYRARAVGTCTFTPDPSADDFIAYKDLTAEVVLEWCWADELNQSLVELSLASQIEEQKTPTIKKGLPWA
jgi:hypothetical protein